MHDSVSRAFNGFSTEFEGRVPFMYQDIKGLITIGVGNLIDPIEAALALPFVLRRKSGVVNPGAVATQAEIRAEWTLIKSKPELASRGHRACEPLCTLELTEEGIDALVLKKLGENEAFLKRQPAFSKFDEWPADAQLGLLSMAWAMGPGFSPTWPRFSAACANLDFASAAANCEMNAAGNPGLVPRNKANRTLFRNAAAVMAGGPSGAKREVVHYPKAL